MTLNPLERAVRSGVKMNDKIGALFAKIGTEAHPRGDVLSVYRTSRLALRSALAEPNRLLAVSDVLRGMRRDLQREVSSVFSDGISLGNDEAKRQLDFYGAQPGALTFMTEEAQAALDAVMARFDSQSTAIRALILTDADETQIVGDEDRTGVLSSGEFISAAAYWATYLIWNAFDGAIRRNQAGLDFQKQAVAAIDARTTDCCLRVHGQIKPFDMPFKLTGTPRFADEMDWPGFHWYCRTSGVLYLAGYDDGITGRMRDAAQFFLTERAAGRTPDRDPANAY